MIDFNTYSPHHDEHSGTSMSLDPKGSWVHVSRAHAMKAENERLRAENSRLRRELDRKAKP